MQQERFNLMERAKSLLVSLFALFLFAPSTGVAKSLGEALSNPGMKRLMFTIAMLNKAMQDAADNPMDQWRRQNVAHAMGMMPMAIAGLAKEFQAGKLTDNDFPMVQQVLGGFIDKNVGDRYTNFAKNPSRNLIPQVGQSFPKDVLASGGGGPANQNANLYFDDSAAKGGPSVSTVGDASKMPKRMEDELANLSNVAEPAKTEKKESQNLYFDESVAKGAPAEAAPASESTSSVGAAKSSAPLFQSGSVDFNSQLVRDLSSVESSLGYREPAKAETLEKPSSPESSLEGDVPSSKAGLKRPAKRRRPGEYRTKINPQFFSWEEVALAAGLYGPFGPENSFAEDSGNKSAEVLFGIAAIMAGIAPMVAASMQASADKEIAKTNAKAQITMTQISANTSKFLADNQKQVALQQADTARAISKENQDSATRRLQMQLAELRSARQESNAIEDKKQRYQERLDGERLALAKQQADETVRLANSQMRAQLSAAGVSQGFSRTINSAAGLGTVNGFSVAARSPSTAAVSGAPVSASGPSLGAPSGSALGVARSNTNPALGSVVAMGSLNNNLRRGATNKLLANATAKEETEGEWVTDPKTGRRVYQKKGTSVAVRAARGGSLRGAKSVTVASTSTVGNGLKGVLEQNRGVAGSTAIAPVKVAATAPVTTPSVAKPSFGEFLNRAAEAQQPVRAVRGAAPTPAGGHTGAYSEPDLSALDRGLGRPRHDRALN